MNNFILKEYHLVKGGQPLRKGARTLTIPIWVYAVVVGIVVSALMALKTGREERLMEMENIEQEGEIYMKRLEREKELKEELKEELKATSE
jgi:Na+/glutamate symporter